MERLQNASESTVRAILTALCDDDRVRAKALQYLARLEAKAGAPNARECHVRGQKRKATSNMVSICVQCGAAFEEGLTEKDCVYYTGKWYIPSSDQTCLSIATHLELT
jgi:ribosomal protein L32